jgi:dienelactone hydrolase
MQRDVRRARAALALLALCASAGAGCTTTPPQPEQAAPRAAAVAPGALQHTSVPLSEFRVTPEGLTVESHFLLHLYTFFHSRDYTVSRVEFPGHAGRAAVAHWLVPRRAGPHPTALVFPILAGSHVVSEALAKALVNRGYAVAHIERKDLALETAATPDVPSNAMRDAVLDARRLLDWLEAQPEVDRGRIAAAGVSMGGILGCILQGVDPRVRAGFYVMAGGGVAELLYDSAEKPVRAFRDRLMQARSYASRDAFVAAMRELTLPIDPLTVAANIPSDSVLIASGRLDRVMPRERTQRLWEALGRPAWIHLPLGHYQLLPFFWWTVGRGADHLDAYFAKASAPAAAPEPRALQLGPPAPGAR